jgi:hypothetical protein
LVLGQVGFGIEDVPPTVEPASRTNVMHTHLPVAMGAFHQVLQRDVLVRTV